MTNTTRCLIVLGFLSIANICYINTIRQLLKCYYFKAYILLLGIASKQVKFIHMLIYMLSKKYIVILNIDILSLICGLRLFDRIKIVR